MCLHLKQIVDPLLGRQSSQPHSHPSVHRQSLRSNREKQHICLHAKSMQTRANTKYEARFVLRLARFRFHPTCPNGKAAKNTKTIGPQMSMTYRTMRAMTYIWRPTTSSYSAISMFTSPEKYSYSCAQLPWGKSVCDIYPLRIFRFVSYAWYRSLRVWHLGSSD